MPERVAQHWFNAQHFPSVVDAWLNLPFNCWLIIGLVPLPPQLSSRCISNARLSTFQIRKSMTTANFDIWESKGKGLGMFARKKFHSGESFLNRFQRKLSGIQKQLGSVMMHHVDHSIPELVLIHWSICLPTIRCCWTFPHSHCCSRLPTPHSPLLRFHCPPLIQPTPLLPIAITKSMFTRRPRANTPVITNINCHNDTPLPTAPPPSTNDGDRPPLPHNGHK